MSDIAPQFLEAFKSVFHCDPKILYCTWHVDKAWQEQLRSKIHDFELESQVYKQIRIVLEQTDKHTFRQYLQTLCERLRNSEATKTFSEYFKIFWVPYANRWAYCYCCGLGINTNVFCKAFHRVFKYCYLQGKQNRCVDKCLVNLLKYSRDKAIERIIKLTKGKLTSRIKMMQQRHQKSLLMNSNNIEEVSETAWKVSSESRDRAYDVQYTQEDCVAQNCVIKCLDCNICMHKYSCTFIDYLLYCTLCKHIHLVHQNKLRLGTIQNANSMPADQTDCDELTNLMEIIQNEQENNFENLKKKARDFSQ